VIAVSILVPALGVWQPWKPRTPASHPAARSAHSPAREWVAKARALFEPWSFATQDDFRQAEQFLKRATELDPGDSEAWAAQAILSCGFDEMGYDRSAERARNARLQADRAVKLAPDSDYARFALGFAMSNDRGSATEGLRLLHELIERHPQDKLMLRTLGRHLAVPGMGRGTQFQEGVALLERAAALPGGDPIADFIRGQALHRTAPYRFAEALAAFDRALALAPHFADAYLDKLEVLLEKLGDPETSRAVVEKLPPAVLREDRVVAMAAKVWFAVDEPAQVLRVVGPTNRYFETRYFTGPVALLRGLAHRRAGRMTAAQAEWRIALQQVEARLEANPNDVLELLIKTRLHVVLGESKLAETTAELAEQLASATSRIGSVLVGLNKVRVVAKSPEEGARNLTEMLAAGTSPRIRQLAASNILFDPELDAQRADPRFAVAIEMAKAFFAEQRKDHAPNP
jgi:tetratricopeptide (TPR) repeat protein